MDLTPVIDEWYDWWRVANAALSLYALYLLLQNFRNKKSLWNAKTRDYWYAMVIWTITAAVASVEMIFQDGPLGTRLVFTTAACLATIIGLRRPGAWGTTSA